MKSNTREKWRSNSLCKTNKWVFQTFLIYHRKGSIEIAKKFPITVPSTTGFLLLIPQTNRYNRGSPQWLMGISVLPICELSLSKQIFLRVIPHFVFSDPQPPSP